MNLLWAIKFEPSRILELISKPATSHIRQAALRGFFLLRRIFMLRYELAQELAIEDRLPDLSGIQGDDEVQDENKAERARVDASFDVVRDAF